MAELDLADPDVVQPADAIATLTRAVQELSLAESLEQIQQIVRVAARKLTGADGATFVLRCDDQCVYADEDAIEPLWKGQRFPLESCISGWAMLNRQHVVIEDIYADDRIPHFAYRPTFVKSLVMVPIRTVDPLGAIGLYWASHHHADEQTVGLAKALADSTAVALGSVQRIEELNSAHRLADTDALTGLPNRRAWDRAFTEALVSESGPLCVAVIDLDHFKHYNDEHGHPEGDRLLRDSAAAWSDALRGYGGVVARVGGEEFAVILPDAGLETARSIAGDLRRAVAPGCTASIGIAMWDRTESAETLLVRADLALYQAKAAGRDCTVAASLDR